METIHVSNNASAYIEYLRDDNSQKEMIADSFSDLAEMLVVGHTESDLAIFADGIIKTMSVLSAYNRTINLLRETSDETMPRFVIK